MNDQYEEVIQDSARGTGTTNTETYEAQETLSNNNSDEILNPIRNVFVKIKFTNGTLLELPISEK